MAVTSVTQLQSLPHVPRNQLHSRGNLLRGGVPPARQAQRAHSILFRHLQGCQNTGRATSAGPLFLRCRREGRIPI